jgi:glucan biosynthesis protein
MEKIKTMEEAMHNPDLDEVVQVDNELKTFVVDYVGKELKPETGTVTVEMVIDVLASHFPELVFAIAEENFIRGYQQAVNDLPDPAYDAIVGRENGAGPIVTGKQALENERPVHR